MTVGIDLRQEGGRITRELSDPLVVGLTGSIGSGKSTVAALLAELGAEVIDADQLAREVVEPKTEGLGEIARTFGPEFISSDGTLNRSKLGQLVFSDPTKLKELEDILHPRIHQRFLSQLATIKNRVKRPSMIVYDVPLLFESRYDFNELDNIVVVTAPKAVCLERIARRSKLPLALIEQRFSTQLPMEQKVAKADFVIYNDGSLEYLKQQVKDLFNKLMMVRQ